MQPGSDDILQRGLRHERAVNQGLQSGLLQHLNFGDRNDLTPCCKQSSGLLTMSGAITCLWGAR